MTSALFSDPEAPQSTYQVALPEFYGPMDLLLALIEQEDLAITRISLAQVTDQFLAYLKTLQSLTPDDLTPFLVIAAKLLYIKSEVLLPRPPPSVLISEEEEDPDDLVRQLREYKRFKEISGWLGELQNRGERSFVRVAPPPKIEPRLDLGNVTPERLRDLALRALAIKPEPPSVGEVVSPEFVTIGQKISLIRQHLGRTERFTFAELLDSRPSRVEVIVTLLAVLELIKRRVLDVEQIEAFGQIDITRRTDAPDTVDWDSLTRLEDVS